MKSFSQFVKESKGYPNWVRLGVVGIVMKIRNIQSQIESEPDSEKRDKLLSKQLSLLGYLNGLGIGVDTKDRNLMSKMSSGIRSKK